jgi:NAD-dependent deacetylase
VSTAGAERLAELIRGAGSVIALTGAGVSVPSGIPDFRSPRTGLWTGVDPMEVAHIDVFRRDPARFWHFYGDRFQTLEHKRPNRAHAALATLEREGLLDAVITQNIDRLHHLAGTRELIEVHGTIEHSSCLVCGRRYPLAEVRERQRADDAGVPRCDCDSPLKPDVVLFGEYLPEEALRRAEGLAAGADLLLCIGSSLEVHPVAQLPATTVAAGGRLALITRGATPFDSRAAVRLSGDVVEELQAVLGFLGLADDARPQGGRRAGRDQAFSTARARSAASSRPSANATVSSSDAGSAPSSAA